MTQEKISGGAFCNICNGVQYFFKNFKHFHQTMINQIKVKNMFEKILHALNLKIYSNKRLFSAFLLKITSSTAAKFGGTIKTV